MNTADRSIALLDVALRRRFQFEEMMPDATVIRQQLTAALDEDASDMELSAEQVELIAKVFEQLNRRVAVLLDRDHQIGHSYFLSVRSMADLRQVLYRRVFPLLQEYFYNDHERLLRVVGAHDPDEGSGFVAQQDAEAGALPGDAAWRDQAPLWSFHRYQTGELDEALRKTFLSDGRG
jgi:5-methylcytosine-specific restriction protein B